MKKTLSILKDVAEECTQRFKKETFPYHESNAESFKTTTDLHISNVTTIKGASTGLVYEIYLLTVDFSTKLERATRCYFSLKLCT